MVPSPSASTEGRCSGGCGASWRVTPDGGKTSVHKNMGGMEVFTSYIPCGEGGCSCHHPMVVATTHGYGVGHSLEDGCVRLLRKCAGCGMHACRQALGLLDEGNGVFKALCPRCHPVWVDGEMVHLSKEALMCPIQGHIEPCRCCGAPGAWGMECCPE